ncbi:hypothetical protein [Streptosporangium sp. NPDC002524]|uniref:hypothetical protein n=1 Tax=Streptosporangium sp. NPDC002524 TaxID=3154537 RepID=UPI003317A612
MNDSFIPAARAAAGKAGPGGTPTRRSSRPENGRGRAARLGTAAYAPVEAS